MSLIFAPMTEADARRILDWRYPPPYDVYNAPDPDDGRVDDLVRELLDVRSPHFTVREAGAVDAPLVAYFAYGSACEIGEDLPAPYLLRADGSLSVGLGLRPDLMGQGRGLELVEAGLAFARERYQPTLFRLYVLAWNVRAIRVYERAGFTRVGEARLARREGEYVFFEMTRLP